MFKDSIPASSASATAARSTRSLLSGIRRPASDCLTIAPPLLVWRSRTAWFFPLDKCTAYTYRRRCTQYTSTGLAGEAARQPHQGPLRRGLADTTSLTKDFIVDSTRR